MTKKELMQAIEENVKGEQFALYCGNDEYGGRFIFHR